MVRIRTRKCIEKNVEKRTNHKKITKDYMKRVISKRTKTYRLKRDSVTWPFKTYDKINNTPPEIGYCNGPDLVKGMLTFPYVLLRITTLSYSVRYCRYGLLRFKLFLIFQVVINKQICYLFFNAYQTYNLPKFFI